MKCNRNYINYLTIAASTLLVISCMLPGMIPLKSDPEGPRPVMETDGNAVIQVLSGQDWHYLQALAKERYTPEELNKPGTLTFTVSITDDLPTYFVYGWCAVDDQTLQQNFEHITVKMYFNGDELGEDVVQNLVYTSPDNLRCQDFGVLMSEWTDGNYTLKAVATFDEKLNDGMADYEPGDYISEYTVTVKKQNHNQEGAEAPSPVSLQTGI
jgi:hypothetical protein